MAGALQILFLCIAGYIFGRRAPIRRSHFIILSIAIALVVGFGPTIFKYSDQLPEALVLIAPFHLALLAFPWLFASAIGRILRREAQRTPPKNRSEQGVDRKPDHVPS